MDDKGYKKWLKQFYGTSCGIDDVDITPYLNDAESQGWYKTDFLEPIAHVFGLSSTDEISLENMTQFLSLMANGKLKGWAYVLREVFFKYYTPKNNVSNDVKAAINSFLRDVTPIVVGTARGKDFIRYVYLDSDVMVGLNARNVCCIGTTVDYQPGINNISILATKDPWSLKDNEVDALRTCCNVFKGEDHLDVSSLRSANHLVLDANKNVVKKDVTAVSMELGPYAIRSLISCLSQSDINEAGGNPYRAAYNYIMLHKNQFSFDVIEHIRKCVNDDNMELMTTLEPKVVLEYINSRYGTTFESLDDVVYQPTSNPVLSMYDVSNAPDDILNMSVNEFVNSEEVEPEMCGTFDELIVQYCTENNVDLNCTINQLLDAIATETLCTPKEFIDHLTEFVEHSDVDGATTIDELLQGIEHVSVPESERVIKYINGLSTLSASVKVAIAQAITDNYYFDRPSKASIISDYLADLEGLPEDIVKAIYDNVNDGTPINYQPSVNVTVDGDKIYKAAEFLLRKMREALSKNDDYKYREGAIPIVYSFVRVLMYSTKSDADTSDLVEFLQTKANDCNADFRAILNEAIEMLK